MSQRKWRTLPWMIFHCWPWNTAPGETWGRWGGQVARKNLKNKKTRNRWYKAEKGVSLISLFWFLDDEIVVWKISKIEIQCLGEAVQEVTGIIHKSGLSDSALPIRISVPQLDKANVSVLMESLSISPAELCCWLWCKVYRGHRRRENEHVRLNFSSCMNMASYNSSAVVHHVGSPFIGVFWGLLQVLKQLHLFWFQMLSKPENCCGLKESEVLSLLNDVGTSGVFFFFYM